MDGLFDIEKLKELLEAAREHPGILEFFLLGLCAGIEYLFPPFPGDIVVLLGAFLVGRFGWSLPGVLIAVNAGAAVGLTLDYLFGRWMAKRDAAWRAKHRFWGRLGPSIDRFDVFYRRWGAICILMNRFVPAVRAIFFVAAGMSRLAYWKVLVLGLASSIAWNFVLIFAGMSVGHNWDKLRAFLRTYSTAAWIVSITAAVVLLAVWFVVRRRKRAGGGG